MVRIISVVSGKGGVGKTTITINLAATLAKYFRKRVLIVDTNFTTSHLGLSLGIFYPKSNLNKILRNEDIIENAIHNYFVGMDLLPLSLSIRDLEGVDISKLPHVLNSVREKYDYIFLDSAPGIGKEVIYSLNACNEVLYIATPFLASITDIIRVQEVVKELNKNEIGLIINMIRNKSYEMKLKEIETLTNLKILGTIPYDEKFLYSQHHKLSVVDLYPDSKLTKIFIEIASNLTNEKLSREKHFLIRFIMRIWPFK